MDQVKKLAKNHQWFRQIVQKAPLNYKNANKLTDMDENQLKQAQFSAVLDYICLQAQITPPTKQQKIQLFQQFNVGKNYQVLLKQQYEKFTQRLFQMLSCTISN